MNIFCLRVYMDYYLYRRNKHLGIITSNSKIFYNILFGGQYLVLLNVLLKLMKCCIFLNGWFNPKLFLMTSNRFSSVHLHTQRQSRFPQNAAPMTCPCSPCQHDPRPSTPNAYTNKTYPKGWLWVERGRHWEMRRQMLTAHRVTSWPALDER